MPKTGDFIDDLSKLALGAAGAAKGAQKELEIVVQQKIQNMLKREDVVPREDFEMLKDMVLKLRTELDALKKQKAPPKKPATKKTTPKKTAKKPVAKKTSSTGKSTKK
ncbi:MAG: accessory factor UbiK family protein [Parvibaculales bacterium]